VAMRQAALVSDESALEACACSRRCTIQIDDLYLYVFVCIARKGHHQNDLYCIGRDVRYCSITVTIRQLVCLSVHVKAFEDLDEIIARYIQPMAAYARDLLSYKYHVDTEGGRRDILDRILIDDKRKQPSRSAAAAYSVELII